MISKWIEDLAAGFWESAGCVEPFPRDLRDVVMACKDANIVELPNLCVSTTKVWLQRRGANFPMDGPDRPLNGCQVAYRGRCFLFVEESLPADDQRMIVAHEFGHYLADHEYPRERATRRLGPSLLSVYDGDRAPTRGEQLGATLAHVPLGVYVHYMDRTEKGTYSEPTSVVERNATDLAFELIAPWRTVLSGLRRQNHRSLNLKVCITELRQSYGIPKSWAIPYAAELLCAAKRVRTFSEAFGLT